MWIPALGEAEFHGVPGDVGNEAFAASVRFVYMCCLFGQAL